MTDITKCGGKGCKRKKTCYRYTAKAGMLQSYFLANPNQHNECEYYWEVTNGVQRKKETS